MSLSLGPALALGLTIPLMHFTGTDWRGTLALWAGCGLVGVLLWIVYTRNVRDRGTPERAPSSKPSAIPLSHGVRSVLSDPAVWQLAFYLGITSMTFYTVSTWLPTTLMMADIKPAAAGNYTAAINILAMPIAFIAPTLTRRGYAKLLAPLVPSGAILGIVLLLTVGASGVVIIVILFGVSHGLCLGVSYDQIIGYAQSPEHAAAISAVTSALGVALAALGPLAYGFGLEATASATSSLIGLGGVVVFQLVLGLNTGQLVARRQPAARCGIKNHFDNTPGVSSEALLR